MKVELVPLNEYLLRRKEWLKQNFNVHEGGLQSLEYQTIREIIDTGVINYWNRKPVQEVESS